jgi:hypothetical protein
MLYQAAWQQLATREGTGHTLVTDADAFADYLDNNVWQSVTVLACYTQTEPTYVASLRAYMQITPETRTTLLLWHPNGVMPPPHTLVTATTANVIWNRGMTGLGYAMDITTGNGPGGLDPESGSAYAGYRWPDFADVIVRDWRPVLPSPVFDGPAPGPGGTGYDDCTAQCLNAYLDDLECCWQRWELRAGRCALLYGPSATDPGDPEAYAACMRRAHTRGAECVETAMEDHEDCVAICEKQHTGIQANP